MFSLSKYDYSLPKNLIAQNAINPHHKARLMVINRSDGAIIDESTFWELDTFLEDDRILFFNNSKVVPSRVLLSNNSYIGSSGNAGVIKDGEIFFLSKISETKFHAIIRPGNKFKIGTKITIAKNIIIEVIDYCDDGRILNIEGTTIDDFLNTYGTLPLPPYIEYGKEKEQDYQTVFATKDGSVAAPTASLHFTDALLQKLSNTKKYLTLHVGLGTFKGIKTDDIRDYDIHQERIEVDIVLFQDIAQYKYSDQKNVAVGTTVCRTLESLPYVWKEKGSYLKKLLDTKTNNYWDMLTKNIENQNWVHNFSIDSSRRSIEFSTSIYIVPGYTFSIVDELITNFHLPKSSLLVLVCAFLGSSPLDIYKYAIKHKYRFYSFGDGLYIRLKK